MTLTLSSSIELFTQPEKQKLDPTDEMRLELIKQSDDIIRTLGEAAIKRVGLIHRTAEKRRFIEATRQRDEKIAILSGKALTFFNSDASNFLKAHTGAWIAANTQDPLLIKQAHFFIDSAHPLNGNTLSDQARHESNWELKMAIANTTPDVTFVDALLQAEKAEDTALGRDFDEDVLAPTEDKALRIREYEELKAEQAAHVNARKERKEQAQASHIMSSTGDIDDAVKADMHQYLDHDYEVVAA